MGILDMIGDRDSLVCTYCGEKPIVGVTYVLDAELDAEGEAISHELDKSSLIAVCKKHLPILQEMFEKEAAAADFVEELGGDGDE